MKIISFISVGLFFSMGYEKESVGMILFYDIEQYSVAPLIGSSRKIYFCAACSYSGLTYHYRMCDRNFFRKKEYRQAFYEEALSLDFFSRLMYIS